MAEFSLIRSSPLFDDSFLGYTNRLRAVFQKNGVKTVMISDLFSENLPEEVKRDIVLQFKEKVSKEEKG